MGRSTTVTRGVSGQTADGTGRLARDKLGCPKGEEATAALAGLSPAEAGDQEEPAAATPGTGEHQSLIKTWKDLRMHQNVLLSWSGVFRSGEIPAFPLGCRWVGVSRVFVLLWEPRALPFPPFPMLPRHGRACISWASSGGIHPVGFIHWASSLGFVHWASPAGLNYG